MADNEAVRDLMARAVALRAAAGISLAVMADHVRVSPRFLATWERTPAAALLPEYAAPARRWAEALAALDRAATRP